MLKVVPKAHRMTNWYRRSFLILPQRKVLPKHFSILLTMRLPLVDWTSKASLAALLLHAIDCQKDDK